MGQGGQRRRGWVIGSVECPVCGWRFYRDSSLRKHMTGFHPGQSAQAGRPPQAPTDQGDASESRVPPLGQRWRAVAGIGAFLWIPAWILLMVAIGSVDPEAEEPPALAVIATLVFVPATFAAGAALVLAVRHLYTEAALSIGWKTAWTALLLFFNVFALPVYFLRHMVKSSAPEEEPSKRSSRELEEAARGRAALDALAAKLSQAPEVPLTRSVRVDPSDLAGLAGEVSAAAERAGEEGRAEQLSRLILAGPRVPFTDQVRVNRRKALRLIDDLRSALESSASGRGL